MNRDMLTRRLKRYNHTVATAENGRRALECLQTQSFDLVLLDIMMPEMNGYQVLEAMKADPNLRDMPVIMISAVDELDSVVRCIELGAEDYLPKPFNPVLLKARIGAVLDKKHLRDQERAYLRQIELEKRRADDLLHVILPDSVIEELKQTNTIKPRRYENVAVLFCDIVDFTKYCDEHDTEEVTAHLCRLVEIYEKYAADFGLEKIKTVGDAFMGTGGLLHHLDNPVLNCVECGLQMVSAARMIPPHWQVRVGIHVGPVMAGVVGQRQYLFDVWGDTVNTAARIESRGVPNAVNVSGEAWNHVAQLCIGESEGLVTLKGKGEMELVRVDSMRHTPATASVSHRTKRSALAQHE
jgi:DNA-binding response OmpR family regulator